MPANLDDDLLDQIVELTRRAEAASDEAAATLTGRRNKLCERAGYHCRIREDPTGDVLVLFPDEWITDGVVDQSSIDDVDRAMEVPLSPTATEEDWERIHQHNLEVAAAVEDRHGPVHGATALALTTYLSNHHLRRIEEATDWELEVFRSEYFPRNAWPSESQRSTLERSIELTLDIAQRIANR